MPYLTRSAGTKSVVAELIEKLDGAEREKLSLKLDLKSCALVFADDDITATLECLIESNLNVSLAARRLYMHRNTLIYRLKKVKRITGQDACTFEGALNLVIAHALINDKK